MYGSRRIFWPYYASFLDVRKMLQRDRGRNLWTVFRLFQLTRRQIYQQKQRDIYNNRGYKRKPLRWIQWRFVLMMADCWGRSAFSQMLRSKCKLLDGFWHFLHNKEPSLYNRLCWVENAVNKFIQSFIFRLFLPKRHRCGIRIYKMCFETWKNRTDKGEPKADACGTPTEEFNHD